MPLTGKQNDDTAALAAAMQDAAHKSCANWSGWSGTNWYQQPQSAWCYCPSCGRRLQPGWSYCPACGSPTRGYSLPGDWTGTTTYQLQPQPLGFPYSSGISVNAHGNTQ